MVSTLDSETADLLESPLSSEMLKSLSGNKQWETVTVPGVEVGLG